MYSMRKSLITTLAAFIGLLAVIITMNLAFPNTKSTKSIWVKFPGDSKVMPFYPDSHSTYWFYAFYVNPDDPFAILKIKAQFPHARYMSYNFYDITTGNPLSNITDVNLVPDQGSENPYVPGASRDAQNRDYTLTLVRASSAAANKLKAEQNTIVIPNGLTKAGLVIRVYLPDDQKDPQGGVALPTVNAYDANMNVTALPPTIPIKELDFQSNIDFIMNETQIEVSKYIYDASHVSFFGTQGLGMFANSDNHYLTAGLGGGSHNNQVAVFRLLPPTYEDTRSGELVVQGNTDVRYFSFCLGGIGSTRTTTCLADDELAVGNDGYITIVVGPRSVASLTKKMGWNYLPWGKTYMSVAIYRHMLPASDFEGSVTNVPQINTKSPAFGTDAYREKMRAENYIGDYAPIGKIFTVEAFRSMTETATANSK